MVIQRPRNENTRISNVNIYILRIFQFSSKFRNYITIKYNSYFLFTKPRLNWPKNIIRMPYLHKAPNTASITLALVLKIVK